MTRGDKLLCIRGNEELEEGRVYTYETVRHCNWPPKDYGIKLMEIEGLWDDERFMPAPTKGSI